MNKTVMNINKIQIIIGLAALLLGFSVYTIRSPGSVFFVPEYFFYLQFSDYIVNMVRIAGNNLPGFIHPFSFILITSGLIFLTNRINQLLICVGWFFLECFFELGQYFKEAYLRIIPHWFDDLPILEDTKKYFLKGTFDVFDMFFIFAGAATAFFVLLITSKKRKE